MKVLNAQHVISNSRITFGTSGARGLVEQFTPDVCAAFTVAFVNTLQDEFTFDTLALAIDNRPSSYAMARACATALSQKGINTLYYGVIPTPALAYTAMQRNIPCIMVTGSHIPFDRNGLKFYRPDGEISKQDEQSISSCSSEFNSLNRLINLTTNISAGIEYIERYTSLFDKPFLSGKRIGIYEHSSAGRDLYQILFEKLGANVIALERSDKFVPIDTEAVSKEDQQKATVWSKQHQLDAIFSTDGDGDRPLIADEKGNWLRGDILGLLCAKQLNIQALAIPVSCNTSIELSQAFSTIKRTKIGSPYVIAEFKALNKTHHTVSGFEANGGFLLGSDTQINNKTLKALPTRDAVLPAIMLLSACIKDATISQLVEKYSLRFSASDRIKNFATEKSKALITEYSDNASALTVLLGFDNLSVLTVDTTDGLRITLSNNSIVHIRPSGNAPELRCYAESTSEPSAKQLVVDVLKSIKKLYL